MPTHHLLVGFPLWGLEGLHDPPHAGILPVKEAGYSLMQLAYYNVVPEVVGAIKKHGLGVVLQRTAANADELLPALAAGKRHGALLINVHAGHPHMAVEDVAPLINGMIDAAEEHGMRLLFETHRGQYTQDLFRTVQLLDAVPRMKLTLDVSHYILAEERPGPVAEIRPLLDQLLPRVEMIHGRVSNGQQIQVDIGDGTGELACLYRDFWADAMREWRRRNPPGSTFMFIPELGPPPYSMTDLAGREISNRWQQSLVLRGLAEQAWKQSASPAS